MTTRADEESLECLKKLIKESDEPLLFSKIKFTDDFLLRYIRSRNHDASSAYKRLLNHMTVRVIRNPEIFARLYPSAVYPALEGCGARVLRDRDDKGRGVLWVRCGGWDPDLISVDDYLLCLMLLGWEMLGSEGSGVGGIVVVVDARGFGVKHAKCGTPGNVQKYCDLILKASPFKCKGAHVLFAPLVFNMTMSLVKMFLPPKLRNRIHVHSSVDTLHEHLPREMLPESLGGVLGEDEAVDEELMRTLRSEERDRYYRGFL